MQTVSRYKLPAHLIGWAIFFFAPLLMSPGPGLSGILQPNVIWPTLARTIILMGLFYLNLMYLTPVVLKRHGIIPFLLAIVTVIIVVSVVNDLIHITYTEVHNRPQGPPNDFGPGGRRPGEFGPGRRPMLMLAGPMLSSFLITIMIASVSTSIVFWNDWNTARQSEQDRALQKVASELAILKLQVSPHFLFNTLNNIRWLIRSRSDKAEEAVIRLSQLLRYILYQTNAEKVPLEKEIDNLRDLVELQKMRLVNEQQVEFSVEGDVSGKMIAPLLFVPLVENFFKHGDFDYGNKGVISLTVSGDRIVFRTENVILARSASGETTTLQSQDSGIGVANVRKRLALHYPGKHVFSVSEDGNRYQLEMDVLLS